MDTNIGIKCNLTICMKRMSWRRIIEVQVLLVLNQSVRAIYILTLGFNDLNINK